MIDETLPLIEQPREYIHRITDQLIKDHRQLEWMKNPLAGWTESSSKKLFLGRAYRVKPTPDYFKWKDWPEKYNHFRRNQDGGLFLFTEEPKPSGRECFSVGRWVPGAKLGEMLFVPREYLGHEDNGMAWDEMILDRPEGE